jgi:hypothetical protein
MTASLAWQTRGWAATAMMGTGVSLDRLADGLAILIVSLLEQIVLNIQLNEKSHVMTEGAHQDIPNGLDPPAVHQTRP